MSGIIWDLLVLLSLLLHRYALQSKGVFNNTQWRPGTTKDLPAADVGVVTESTAAASPIFSDKEADKPSMASKATAAVKAYYQDMMRPWSNKTGYDMYLYDRVCGEECTPSCLIGALQVYKPCASLHAPLHHHMLQRVVWWYFWHCSTT